APKLRSMEIIKELENEPRGVYCGAIGLISPNNSAVFNVPIRTVVVEGSKAEMGIGSGVLFESNVKNEYEECLLKSKFLTNENPKFRLIETILWKDEFIFLEEHLKRLRNSAEYFDFNFNEKLIKTKLHSAVECCKKRIELKIRLLLSKNGDINVEKEKKTEDVDRRDVIISNIRVNSSDIFLFHKTTERALYNKEYKKYSPLGYYDIIFMNERGEFTEGTFNNIIIEADGKFYTPPVNSGLLAGIYRECYIKKYKIKEKVLFIEDLEDADKIYLCNSVRGISSVKIKKDLVRKTVGIGC
ncbi:MAG: aminotransferase class IV, partial [bacterium]